MNLGEWLKYAEERLSAAGIASSRLDARVIAAESMGVPISFVLAHPEAAVPSKADEWLARRESRDPLAYILGWREFYGRRFAVSPAVLVPRQETETLIEEALPLLKPGFRILDIGAGSGCISVTLALEGQASACPVSVTACDISTEALAVARANAKALGAEVEFIGSDLFSVLPGRAFDLILSNPPYIAETEELMPEVAIHEPRRALFSGPTGLEFYERLAAQAGEHLSEGGKLLLEVGHTQAGEVSRLFEDNGWRVAKVAKDLSGVDRVLCFHRSR